MEQPQHYDDGSTLVEQEFQPVTAHAQATCDLGIARDQLDVALPHLRKTIGRDGNSFSVFGRQQPPSLFGDFIPVDALGHAR